MGAALTCCAISNCLCCCSSTACHCCGKITSKSSVATRAAYATLFMLTAMFSWTMLSGWLESVVNSVPYTDFECPQGRCSGSLSVHRVLFALSLFHCLMSLIMIRVKTSKDKRAGLQNGWWGPKLLMYLVFLVIAFLIPNEFFTVYAGIAFAGAILFVFVQLILLIDFAATWSDSWVSKMDDDEGGKKWGVLLLVSAGFMYVVGLVLSILLYVFFGTGGDCGLNIFFVSFNIVLAIVVSGLSVSPKVQEARPSSGILQAAVVVVYATYLVSSALAGESEDYQCYPDLGGGASGLTTVFGTIFTFVAIVYSTTRAAAKSEVLMQSNENKIPDEEDVRPLLVGQTPQPQIQMSNVLDNSDHTNMETVMTEKSEESRQRALEEAVLSGALPASALENKGTKAATPAPPAGAPPTAAPITQAPIANPPVSTLDPNSSAEESDGNNSDDDDESSSKKKHKGQDDERKGVKYNYSFFHGIFCLGSMYVAMLITDWNTNEQSSGELGTIGRDWVSVWVKIISSWLAYALYGWTLVAPLVLPDREFN
eukprot:NODE_147_length_2113_cov_64.937563_g123_i0.p1 GENE.NODE_147_length_2113_cov_64.937563_g123_i0~~NODE_147_length_2113_cov_64.937563_g123_i0.p1  ORF type:complete len:539 (-),score=100.56 NODE_147_length_2113_cov_64.937563_g123_i0:112-1728(-)